ncbi:D-aminoacyl-tRNA deacylase [Andreprevotia chitinilytica]|uniref:D-aminoacyl-tRNA deacylase n=1 Tax=Andreprevotia chitinilytica TaxID=396808 RepID=UPI000558CB3B|nr:D-aminoacyl-tRNA deacylase [Andreprevotia chitinilytica]
MRVLLQRVSQAEVHVDGDSVGRIGPGLLLLCGIEAADDESDLVWAASKISKLRVFEDDAGVMNRSVLDTSGDILAISQFTLFGAYSKGNRPSWGRAAPGEISQPMFERFVAQLEQQLGKPVATGAFGADMKVALINDGPVTLLIDSKDPE